MADAINQWGRSDAHRAFCTPTSARYEGKSLWRCGLWTFDETTGTIFRASR